MSDIFDLDAVIGETTIEPFRFTWGGQQFELPAILAMPVDRQLAIVQAIDGLTVANPARIVEVLKLLIGEDLLAQLNAAKPMSTAGLMQLISAWGASQGATPGKSPASARSSASTARPSKLTSRSARARKTS